MELNHLEQRFAKVSRITGFVYELKKGATQEQIGEAENRLNLTFPEQVKLFYSHFNGLTVVEPGLRFLSVEELEFHTENRLHLATFDQSHNVYFNVSDLNVADQWNIVGEDNFLITHTMASFWSNKIWHWLNSRRPIWMELDWRRVDQ